MASSNNEQLAHAQLKLFLLLYHKSYLPVAGGGAVGEYGGGGSVCSEAIA